MADNERYSIVLKGNMSESFQDNEFNGCAFGPSQAIVSVVGNDEQYDINLTVPHGLSVYVLSNELHIALHPDYEKKHPDYKIQFSFTGSGTDTVNLKPHYFDSKHNHKIWVDEVEYDDGSGSSGGVRDINQYLMACALTLYEQECEKNNDKKTSHGFYLLDNSNGLKLFFNPEKNKLLLSNNLYRIISIVKSGTSGHVINAPANWQRDDLSTEQAIQVLGKRQKWHVNVDFEKRSFTLALLGKPFDPKSKSH